jgi:hypothetical protein
MTDPAGAPDGVGGSAKFDRATRSLKRRSAPRFPLHAANHSHSMVPGDDNTLIYRHNSFHHMAKNRLADPPKIRALEFKNEFR